MLRRRKKTEPPAAERQVQEAKRALRKVQRRDQNVQAASNEILSVVREIKDFQRRNNFARAIRQALGGEGG
jgi:hypothetical protein